MSPAERRKAQTMSSLLMRTSIELALTQVAVCRQKQETAGYPSIFSIIPSLNIPGEACKCFRLDGGKVTFVEKN